MLRLARSLFSVLSAEACWPGVARRQLTFLLLRQKKSKQKKRRPWLLRPSAALRATCGARFRRGLAKLATLRFAQTTRSLIRLNLRSSAHPQGVGKEYQYLRNKDSPRRVLVCICLLYLLCISVFGSRSRLPRPGWAEERRRRRIRDRACLSEASLRETPP